MQLYVKSMCQVLIGDTIFGKIPRSFVFVQMLEGRKWQLLQAHEEAVRVLAMAFLTTGMAVSTVVRMDEYALVIAVLMLFLLVAVAVRQCDPRAISGR